MEKRPKPFGGTQKIICGSQTLKQEAVALKLPWRLQDVRDATAVGYLLKTAANGELGSAQEKVVCCSQQR